MLSSDKSKLNDLIDNHDLKIYLKNLVDSTEEKYYTIDSINEIKARENCWFSIFHLNIRSLNKHSTELIGLLSALNIAFDCVCLTEINKANLNSYSSLLPGYIFHPIPPEHGNVGGVSLFVKQEIKVEKLDKLQLKCCDPCENLWVQLSKNNKEIILGIIYRHPSGNLADFNCKLDETISMVQNIKHDKCMIVGDVNIDLVKYNQPGRAKTKEYLDLMLTHGFLPCTVLPTRITDHTATLIDHIFIKERIQSENTISGNIFTDISDHFANFLLIPDINTEKNLQKRKTRVFGAKNTEKFLKILQNTDWNLVYQENDANRCTNVLNSIVQKAYNEAFPYKTMSRKRLKDKPWVTTSLKKCILQKHNLFAKYLKNRTNENKEKYSCYRNILISCLRSSKTDYFKELFNKKSTRITKMWSVFGVFLNPKKHKRENAIKSLIYNGKILEGNSDVANALNLHFCNIGKNIASKIKQPDKDYSKYLLNPIQNTFYLSPVDESEITKEIQNLKVKKSPGNDDIRPGIIKTSCSILTRPLTHVFNVSFSSGIMPDIWNIAKVIPIFKCGERNLPGNYRPISLLSCFEKILERRIISFLEKHSILYKLQFGFREGHSTTHALLELLEELYSNLDQGNTCLGIFFDLTKAFDIIDHDILLYKLQHYGFRGKIHEWFASYLKNRKQFTFVNGEKSTMGQITKGVPQGSVLGPILFTVYVNDMPNSTKLIPRLFADDTNVFNFGQNIHQLINETKTELHQLDDWLKANMLKVNTAKANYCLFRSSSSKYASANETYNVKMGDILNNSDDTKYLGVILDTQLSWEKQVNKIKSEIIKYTSMFCKLRYYVPKACLTTLYDALVLSKITYAFEVYGCAAAKSTKQLQVLQNRILRILQFKDYRYPTNALHKEANLLKLTDFYEFKILKFMQQVHHNNDKLPTVLQNYFVTNENLYKYDTRQSKHYQIRKAKKAWGNKMMRNKGARLWNALPSSLKSIQNPKKFAVKLKKSIIDQY